MLFTSVGHLINKEMLKDCHEKMDGDKAVGIDGITKEDYSRNLDAVFEPHFYDEMMGFRPNRGCYKAIQRLNTMMQVRFTSYVLDADIKGFFQNLDHEWIIRFIESRIKDPNITRLVRRMLKAGIMNNFQIEATEEGSGQGSVCSPII